jgi:hypothetical protein
MTTVVSVAQGGTGSNSAALARTALGVPPSAAYDQANTARDQANTARTQANTAYAQANSAYSDANTRLSASGGTLAGDLIITGNLTVSGNSTTLNAEILTIEDADVVLLSNVASTPALNAGIIVNRGTSTNTFLRWDEVTDKWGWSDDGSTTYKFTSALDAYAQANSAYGAANNAVLKAGDTMTGELTVSVASSANAVRITQTGGGNALVVEDSANPDASPFIIDAGGQLIQGYTTAINNWNLAPDTFALHSSASNARPSTGLYNWSTNTARVGTFAMYKSISGVVGTNSALTTLGQQFGRIAFCGDDGTSFIRGAEIFASVDGTVGANSMPGKLDFRTTAAGASSPTQRMVIDANGNIGIGISSPTKRLHISGSAIISDGATPANNATLLVQDDGVANTVTSGATFRVANDGSSGSFAVFEASSGVSNTVITNAGNMGIGTTSPATTLHVDASGGGIVRVSRLGTGAGILQLEADGTDGTVTTTNTMKFVTNGSERMRLDTSGNLFLNAFSGRGGGSTGYLFKLNPGKVYLELMANNTTSTSDILFTDGAAGAYGIVGYDHSNDSLRIYTNSSWQMTVNSSGYLGIGNTAPPRRLTVQSLGTGNYEMVVGWAAQSLSQNATMDVICTHDNLAFQVWDDNNYTTPRFVVERGGDVGIGTTNPTQKLDVVGNIKASGTMAANGTIDVAGDGGAGYVGSRIVLRTHNNYRGAGIFLVGETSAVSNNTFYIGTPYSDHSGGLYFRHTANNYQTDYQSAAYTAAGNTIMYMSPGGNVGIGTNSPSSKLHVVGNILANGCPVQVQYTSSGTRTTVDSTSFVEPSTSYRVAITPKSTSSMIRLRFFIPTNADGASNTIYTLRLFRIISGTTSYALTSAGSSNGSRNVIAGSTFRPLNGYDGNDPMPMIIDAVDFPNTTSTCTYGFEFKRETGGGGTVHFGKSNGDNSNWGFDADILIIAEEIGQ